MGVKLAGARGHATIGAFYDYNRPEHEQLTGSELVSVFRADGLLVGRFNRRELQALAEGEGLRSRRRPDANPGQEVSFTLPASVVAAMKREGLLSTPSKTFSILAPAAVSAIRKMNEAARGRTTGGKPVPVQLYYAATYGFTNRAGELAPQVNVWVFGYGRAADGKHLAVDSRRLFYAQKSTQAAWHLEVTARLLHEGITCLPDRNSIKAFGVAAATVRGKQVADSLLPVPYTGPAARARAVRNSRAPKPLVSWTEAARNLAYRVADGVNRAGATISEARQEALAARCVRASFRYHNQAGAARYARGDVYATGAHLAMPHVGAEIYNRAFNRLAARPERLGAEVAKLYPDGNILYSPRGQAKLETRAAKALLEGRAVPQGGLSRKDVTRALAGRGLGLPEYAAVERLAEPRRVVLDPAAVYDAPTLRRTASAYVARGLRVYPVGGEAGRALGLPAYTPVGFAERLDRTPHLQALWRGLRTRGTLNERLRAAERIRAARPPADLKKNSLIVASVGPEDSAALLRMLDAARKTGSKLVVTGQGAEAFAQLLAKHGASQRPKGARM
jgi:hypothetical protein